MKPKPAYTSKDVRQARGMARVVMEHYFGARPKRLIHRASGLSNTVFEVHHDDGVFIVRIAPDATKLASFLKEQWCVSRAREAGVPVAEILEVGQEAIAHPYMIQRLERGEEATHHPQRLEITRELGRIAAAINAIPTEGYGETFQWSSNRLSFNATFASFLEGEYDCKSRLSVLEANGMLTARQVKSVRGALKELVSDKSAAALAHGDLRLKNVLVSADGTIKAVLDWEHCCSAPAPVWDLSIALHDLSIDAKQAFIDGYGLDEGEVAASAPAIKALNVLHYAPHVQKAVEDKDVALLNSYRMRLSGALDLYSLT